MKNKVAVIISGGLVTNIYSKEDIDFIVIDFDNQHPDEEEEANREFKEVIDDDAMTAIY